MGRPVMLGNGSLTVGLNEQGMVHDFYYPYVGLDNLTNARSMHHKVGVWVDGQFSWVDDGSWNISVSFESDAMVSIIRMQSDRFQVELLFNDFVDSDFNAFCRRITVNNLSDQYKNVRIFMHQVFQISRAGRADTALFVPEENYILDYKGRCSLLVYGQSSEGTVYDQFAIGIYGIEGKEGTFRDAEDGELSGNAVEHGGVDSVIRFPCSLSGGATMQLDYWIIAADSQFSAEKIHHQFRSEGLEHRLELTREYWHEWLITAVNQLHTLDKKYLEPVKKSLMTIKVHTDKRGGIIASCDSSIYNFGRDYYSYVWPRDGAFAMWPLIRLGYQEEPRRFFEFCRDILTPDGYLMHKYQPDRAIGSTWHPLLHGNHKELAIQEDETAIVLYMLGEYYDRSHDQDFISTLYTTFIQPAANFMASFVDEQTKLPHASYDLWEEKFLTSTYTTATVYQALLVAADFADIFEYPDDGVHWRDAAADILANVEVFFDKQRGAFRKGFLLQEDGSLAFDNTLDVSSLFGPMMFSLHHLSSDLIKQTLHTIESTLLDKTPAGGCPRYEYDHYFGSDPAYLGNPWFVTTLWLSQYYVRNNQIDKAHQYVDWTLDHAIASGMLSEQVDPTSGSPLSVLPLVWSHAELVNTVLDLAKVDHI
ncbi:MAG TPA: glycoside hydrolase family 15 protein [Candidatus Saccharimonadales bacterium]|jgi:GH15 family glucan-1,4-alpha-glucosidase|nr:glycoside hydrolase family 15 protein [Candidatus Saccharimonadales bacterium]